MVLPNLAQDFLLSNYQKYLLFFEFSIFLEQILEDKE